MKKRSWKDYGKEDDPLCGPGVADKRVNYNFLVVIKSKHVFLKTTFFKPVHLVT